MAALALCAAVEAVNFAIHDDLIGRCHACALYCVMQLHLWGVGQYNC
jgi:hypothetical protein